jgi:hypothetical protein
MASIDLTVNQESKENIDPVTCFEKEKEKENIKTRTCALKYGRVGTCISSMLIVN